MRFPLGRLSGTGHGGKRILRAGRWQELVVGKFDCGRDNGLNRPTRCAYSADADKMPKLLNCGQIRRSSYLGNYWRPLHRAGWNSLDEKRRILPNSVQGR